MNRERGVSWPAHASVIGEAVRAVEEVARVEGADRGVHADEPAVPQVCGVIKDRGWTEVTVLTRDVA